LVRLVCGSWVLGAPSMLQSIWISMPVSPESRVLMVPFTWIGASAGCTVAMMP